MAQQKYTDGSGVAEIWANIKNYIAAQLLGKSNTGHTHSKSEITDFPTIPSNTSQLTNDSGFITSSGSCNYANSSGNADTVDGSHAWQMQTLAAGGGVHGSNDWLMQCQHNVDGDGYFKLYCGDKSVGTKVDRANGAGWADSAGSAGSATTAGEVNTSVAAGSTKNLVYAAMSNNDQCRIMCGGDDNAGYLEIATSDDGNEPIYVRQYNNGTFGSIVRTLTLLDESGNTQFPGTVSAPTFSGNLNGNCNYANSTGYVQGNNNSANAANALLRSGSGRTDSSPGGDTWIFLDELGGAGAPWGFKHNQAANTIGFYGAGTETSSINLSNGYFSGSCNYANSAGNSDTLDGYHEHSFLRYRGETSTSGEGTLWGQIGIKGYYNALPDGLSGVYQWGEVVSLAGGNVRFDIYCSHQSSDGNGLYYRSGWGDDKKAWRCFIDSANIGSQSVNYANSAGSAGSVAWDNVSGKPNAFTPYFANNTWYAVGDDAAIGDHNVGGGLGVKALNSTTTRIDLCYKDDASNFKSITYDGTTLYMNGNCDYATSAGSVAWSNVTGKPTIPTALESLSTNPIPFHNSYPRYKYLGTSITNAQNTAIKNRTYDDLFIGDYWTINDVNWRIVAIDYYYNVGDTNFDKGNIIVMPDTVLYNAQMNTQNTPTSYAGSLMRKQNLNNAKTLAQNAFGSHLANHRILLTSAVGNNMGFPISQAWYDSNGVELPNEIQIYGTRIWGSTLSALDSLDVGSQKQQFPLLALAPQFVNIRTTYWLQDISSKTTSSSYFARVGNFGFADQASASSSSGVRPCVTLSYI